MAYELITLKFPYQLRPKENPLNIIRNVCMGMRPKIQEDDNISSQLSSLLEHCWSENPSERSTFEQVTNLLIQKEYMMPDVDHDEIANYISILNQNTELSNESNEVSELIKKTDTGDRETIKTVADNFFEGKNGFPHDETKALFYYRLLYLFFAYCIYYLDDPPPPTATPFPSRTPFFENNTTYIDREFINYIYTNQIIVSKESPFDQISGCHFINIIEDIDYLIILEKVIAFYDNYFLYNKNQTYASSPIQTRYNGHLIIKNCIFENYNSITKNGCVLTCQKDLMIDIMLESCKFVNCGITTNDIIIQIMNEDSSINFINCLFAFDNETTSSKSICFHSININFENCIFNRSGTIFIDSQSNNSSFRFVNNVASSISQQLLNYKSTNSNQFISGNIFKDFISTHGTFFYFNIFQDEFELINSTFQNISFDYDYYGGGIGLQLIFPENYLMTLLLNNCTFIENTNNCSKNAHGGVFQFGYSPSYMNISVHINNCIFIRNNCLNGYGGALSINIMGDIIIENCSFEYNKADLDGGAIYILGQIDDDNESSLIEKQLVSITNCRFINNQGNDGNFIFLLENEINTNFEISSCVFENNALNQFNIHCSSTNIYYINNTIIFNDVLNSNCFLILSYSEFAEIINSKCINCQTENDSIIIISCKNKNAMTIIMNCEFIDCISKKSSIIIPEGNINIQNCIFNFLDNKNACSGLEIISSNSINISKCKFNNNNNKILNGGSLHIHNNDISIENINIDNILFDSCIGSSYRTMSIELTNYNQDQIKIKDVIIQNISTGSSIFGINIDTNVFFDHWEFKNNQFGNEYGNGYGSYLIPSQHIIFYQCKWINNYCSDNGGAFGGALYNHLNNNRTPLLKLKSISFDECKFFQNSCAGNGGSLYLDMTANNSVISILKCHFEMNKAYGDCGAIFIKNKNLLLIDSCSFINNSALKSISSSSDPTDTLYINGNNNVLINNTNFTKGSYLNEMTNYQLSHINEKIYEKNDFNISISFCMFSIINPTRNQIFMNELNNIGSLNISNSKFTHFITQKKYFLSLQSNDNQSLNKFIKSDFVHFYQNLNIPVHITECCFDNDEILQLSDSILISVNNTLNGNCSYPEITNDLIFTIENYRYPTNIPFNSIGPKTENKKDNKMKIIIGGISGVVLFVIIVISIVVAVVIIKMKKNKSESSTKTYEIDEDQENELTQEINDSLCYRYDRSLSNLANYFITQENPLYTQNIKANSSSTSSSSSISLSNSSSKSQSSSDFEESKWDNSYE